MARETQDPIVGIRHIDFDDSKPADEQKDKVYTVTIYKHFTTRESMQWRNTVMGSIDAAKAAQIAAVAAANKGDKVAADAMADELEVRITVGQLMDANVAVANSVIAEIKDGTGKVPQEVAEGKVGKADWLLDNTRNGDDVLGAIGSIGMGIIGPNAQSGSTKSISGADTKKGSRQKK